MKKTILFLCTHNSARSQISEGLINGLFSNEFVAYSAGTEPASVNPFAIKVLKEIDIDISSHYSKPVDEFDDRHFDYVVTVCDNAKESCPTYMDTDELVHKSFEDPSSYEGSDEEKLERFRATRDEIKKWLEFRFS